MFKKLLICNIIIINIFVCCLVGNVYADDEIEKIDIKNVKEVIETSTGISNIPNINSRYAIVLDRKTNAVLFGKNEYKKTKMASTTKIMTALIVIERAKLDDIVTVSKKAAGTGGSRLKISTSDKISVRDLLYGLMLCSGNDAAVALAEYVAGSVSDFSVLMNEKAKMLELLNTNFETPHGLDSNEHYTTAYELGVLANYALNNEIFYKIVSTKTYTVSINGNSRTISNTNELLGNLSGVYGVKTGFTNGAGRCLVTACKRGELDIVCVVLGADTKKIRTNDSIKLIEYTMNNFKYINIDEKIKEEFENWYNINCNRIHIYKGEKEVTQIKLDEYNIKEYPIKKEEDTEIKISILDNLNVFAPVVYGTKIGKLQVFYGNKIIEEIDIVINEEIQKKNIKDYVYEMLKNYSQYTVTLFR